MDRKKIVHVLHSVGGVDVSLRLITENIDPELFENIIIHGKDDTDRSFLDKNNNPLKEYKLPIRRDISIFDDLKSIFKTIKIFKKEQPDIVHAHSTKGGIIARAASIFYKRTVFHTPQAYSYLSAPKGFKYKLYRSIERIFKHFNSVLVASSPSELNRGIKDIGYSPKKTELFNNSIPPLEGKLGKDMGSIELSENFICTVGRPSYQKNIEMMIEVISLLKEKIPDIHLVLMGVGEYSPNKERVEQLIDQYGLKSNVTLVKWMDRNNILIAVSKSKLYISTARYEGLPYSIIESLAMGKACVVTDADGNRDLVKHEYNGFIIQDFDKVAMADKIYKLYYDDELRAKFEKNSLIFFNENFNMDNNIELLQDLYSSYI